MTGSGRNPLIADQPADTLYAVACVLDALQALPLDELTERGKLGVRFALETAQGALLFEANAFGRLAAKGRK